MLQDSDGFKEQAPNPSFERIDERPRVTKIKIGHQKARREIQPAVDECHGSVYPFRRKVSGGDASLR